MRTLLRLLVIALAALAASAITGTTSVGAASFTYDAPSIARVHAHVFASALAGPAQPTCARERSTLPSVQPKGTSTTPPAVIVATEAAGEVPAYARSQYGRVLPGQRATVLEENPTCVYCGEAPSTQVDHVTPLKQDWNSGGWADDAAARTSRLNDPGNLVGSCQSCNASKNAWPLGEGAGQWWPSGWPSGVWWPFGGPR